MNRITKGMLIACLFYPFLSQAQNEIDALRYSQNTFGSTARSLAMGGAFGALGADFSSLSVNPAGLGVYRKSEFTFSLGFDVRNTKSDFLNNTNSENKFSMNIPDLGLVLAFPKDQAQGWKQFSFALGYNRTNNFYSDSYYEGKNNSNSILNSFTEMVQQDGGASESDLIDNYPFDVNLAYQTYLIDPDTSNPNQYVPVIPFGGAYQSKAITTRGGMGEFSLGFGGNYNDQLYFGVSLAFPSLRYEEESTYEENDRDNVIVNIDSTEDFRSLTYNQYLNTTGNGFNAKFGVIFKPIDWLRIGASIQTPTYYYLNDKYHSGMQSSFGGGSSYSYDSPEGSYSYNLTTPFKATGSLAFVLGQNGAFSVDYEYLDYTSAKLDASDYNFTSENRVIRSIYNDAGSNIRAGLEWKYNVFSFRAGGAYYSSPFKSNISSSSSDQHMVSYTGGIGYREKNYYIDFGYGFSRRSDFSREYILANQDVPGATIKNTDHRVIITMGFRF